MKCMLLFDKSDQNWNFLANVISFLYIVPIWTISEMVVADKEATEPIILSG
jgi:hypothetical protein